MKLHLWLSSKGKFKNISIHDKDLTHYRGCIAKGKIKLAHTQLVHHIRGFHAQDSCSQVYKTLRINPNPLLMSHIRNTALPCL